MAPRQWKLVRLVLVALAAGGAPGPLAAGGAAAASPAATMRASDPTTLLWYTHPAEKWDDALPVGNGRLGAMVFGKTDEEEIPINEEHLLVGRPLLDDGARGGTARSRRSGD